MNKLLMDQSIAKCIKWFYKNYFIVIYQMKNCTQSYNFLDHQPWHMEDDVWTHTLLAVNSLKLESLIKDFIKDSNLKVLPDLNYDLVVMTVLLHDIGKIKARHISSQNRCRFFNHESLSQQEIYEICLAFGFNDNEIKLVLLAINSHSYYYEHQDINNTFKRLNNSLEALRLLIILTKADESGQIRDVNAINVVNKGDKINAIDELIELFFDDVVNEKRKDVDYKFIFYSGIPAAGKDYSIDREMITVSKSGKYSLDQLRLDIYREAFPNNNLNSVDEFEAAFKMTRNKNLKHMMVSGMFQDRNKYDTFYISNTLTTPKSRRRLISSIVQTFRDYSIDIKCVQKFVPIDIIHNRDKFRGNAGGKTVGSNVIVKMSNLLQIATMSEGFDEVDYIMRGYEN